MPAVAAVRGGTPLPSTDQQIRRSFTVLALADFREPKKFDSVIIPEKIERRSFGE
jgi:hypothetical protein